MLLALAINSFSSIDIVSTIYSKLHWSNVCYALQNGKKKVSTNPWWTADVDLCFLVHFLGEFRTIVIIDFKGPHKYCSFLCSNFSIILPIILKPLLISIQNKNKNGRYVACWPGGAHSDCDVQLPALISWGLMIALTAQEKNSM